MPGVDMGREGGEGRCNARLPHKRRRASIRIDMTPMVDVAFLLLVFFMVTTVFRTPQAMEVNLPPEGARVEVPLTKVVTLYVDASERFFARDAGAPPRPLERRDLGAMLREKSQADPDVIVLVKLHPKVRCEAMVRVMDELELADMQRFSLVPMSEEDVRLLERDS